MTGRAGRIGMGIKIPGILLNGVAFSGLGLEGREVQEGEYDFDEVGHLRAYSVRCGDEKEEVRN